MLIQKVMTHPTVHNTKTQKDKVPTPSKKTSSVNKKKSSLMMIEQTTIAKISLIPSQVTFKYEENSSRNLGEVTRSKVTDSDLAIPSSQNSVIALSNKQGGSKSLSNNNYRSPRAINLLSMQGSSQLGSNDAMSSEFAALSHKKFTTRQLVPESSDKSSARKNYGFLSSGPNNAQSCTNAKSSEINQINRAGLSFGRGSVS